MKTPKKKKRKKTSPDKKENFCYAPMKVNYTKEAEKLCKKLPKSNEIFDFPRGYNLAKDEDIKVVADLLEKIDKLTKKMEKEK